MCLEIMICNLKMQSQSSRIFPSLAHLNLWSWEIFPNCKTNLALCCSTCHVLSLYVLFGHFCAYFPIPYRICVHSSSSCNESNYKNVQIGENFTTAVRPCLNKFFRVRTDLCILQYLLAKCEQYGASTKEPEACHL